MRTTGPIATILMGFVASFQLLPSGVHIARAAEGPGDGAEQAQPATPTEELAQVQAILERLRSDQHNERRAATDELRDFHPHDPGSLKALIGGLCRLGSSDVSVQGNVHRYLVRLGAVAVEELTAAMTDARPLVRHAALSILAEIGPPAASAVPKLIELVGHDEPETCRLAAAALGPVGDASEAVVAVLTGALDDPDPKVRDAATTTLAQLARAASNVLPALLALLDDMDTEKLVRHGALLTLAKIGRAAASAAPQLIELVGHDDPVTRQMAVSTLGTVGDASDATVTALIDALSDENRAVRHGALSALAKIGPAAASAAPKLIELVGDNDPLTRRLAIKSLDAVGDASQAAVTALTGAAIDTNQNVRYAALSTLAKIGPAAASAAPRLIELLRHNDPETRRRAASALGALGGTSDAIVAALTDALVDSDRRVRDFAMTALEQHEKIVSDAVPALLARLESATEGEQIRRQALLTLAEIGPAAASAVPKLIELVVVDDPVIRRLATGALFAVRDASPAAVAVLIGAAADPDREVRQLALTALGHLRAAASDAVPVLLALLDDADADPADRQFAATALRRIDPDEAERRLGPGYDPTAVARADIATLDVGPGDWPQWGGSRLRSNVPAGTNIPTDWNIGKLDRKTGQFVEGTSRNIKWAARLGSQTYGNPVIANGHVYIGTNNGGGYLKRHPPTIDLGVLLCLDEETGQFLWQHSSEKLPAGRVHDWPLQGVCSTPLVDGDRLWFVTNRCEVFCLDTEGFRDGENDGPVRDEAFQDSNEADVVWRLDMMGQLGVSPHNMSTCCVLAVDDRLLVCTSNGVDEGHVSLPAPQAPSFMALERDTGKVLWTDNSPGENVLHGQWASPSYAVLGGQPQVLFPGGDGWLYSFDPAGDGEGGSKLLWKFDCNPKEARYEVSGRSTRNHMIAFAAIYDGLVYQTVGEDPEHGEGAGHLWCIDPTKRGDVSPQLVFNVSHPDTPIPPKRYQACVPEEGDFVRDNPNSAAVWHYAAQDVNGDGQITSKDFLGTFHRSLGIPVIKDDILYVADFSGLVHCVDAKTGQPYWTHDMLAACWGSAVLVDDKVYIGDEDGDISIFPHSPLWSVALKRDARGRLAPAINTTSMGNAVYGTPVVANNVLYIANKDHLFAIAADSDE
jgi:HEAT repeat protein/outer membrane protein assembly factor BamB